MKTGPRGGLRLAVDTASRTSPIMSTRANWTVKAFCKACIRSSPDTLTSHERVSVRDLRMVPSVRVRTRNNPVPIQFQKRSGERRVGRACVDRKVRNQVRYSRQVKGRFALKSGITTVSRTRSNEYAASCVQVGPYSL